jgi:hypothetical protein
MIHCSAFFFHCGEGLRYLIFSVCHLVPVVFVYYRYYGALDVVLSGSFLLYDSDLPVLLDFV